MSGSECAPLSLRGKSLSRRLPFSMPTIDKLTTGSLAQPTTIAQLSRSNLRRRAIGAGEAEARISLSTWISAGSVRADQNVSLSKWRLVMISDHQIRQEVLDELDLEPSVMPRILASASMLVSSRFPGSFPTMVRDWRRSVRRGGSKGSRQSPRKSRSAFPLTRKPPTTRSPRGRSTSFKWRIGFQQIGSASRSRRYRDADRRGPSCSSRRQMPRQPSAISAGVLVLPT